ncbi:hypothetical protein Taro_045658 [Colocasia esculenta]|uniref:Uncharacterized protein n=1 Tax=Colocasia esculenta TaxID=4460 RepID=A0A843X6Q5_COLES|nr:hypothetical protein [Colocasia esculenta]
MRRGGPWTREHMNTVRSARNETGSEMGSTTESTTADGEELLEAASLAMAAAIASMPLGSQKNLQIDGLFGWILKGSNKDGIQERLGFFAFAMSTTVYTYSNSLPVFLQEPPIAPWHSYACTWRRGGRRGRSTERIHRAVRRRRCQVHGVVRKRIRLMSVALMSR